MSSMSRPLRMALAAVAGAASLAGGELDFLPLPSFGAEVRGMHVADLVRRAKGSESEQAAARAEIKQIRDALHRERVLAFRRLGTLSWEDQLAFSAFFGEVFNESSHSNRKPHNAIPDPRVAIFSNNPEMGVTGAGTEGWHVDGNVVDVPHAMTFIHAISAVPEGDTFFVPLREVVRALRRTGYLKGKCVERAPPCRGKEGTSPSGAQKGIQPLDDVFFQSGHVSEIRHPLIYPHPVTGLDTMVFGLGTLSGRYHRGCLQPSLPSSLEMTQEETDKVTQAISESIERSNRILRWRWSSGDLLMVDNLAVAHHASDGTQGSVDQVGLRLMQRTTVKGTTAPQKRPILLMLPHECVRDHNVDQQRPDHYCVFSLSGSANYPFGEFPSRDTARQLCRNLAPDVDLAIPRNVARNQAMGNVVAAVGMPHWLGGVDEPNGVVSWVDGSFAADHWDDGELPWHGPSGQPNDCDGPGSETCMFMGPDARWFDFACQPKITNETAGITPGPEIVWGSKPKQMYNVHALCGMFLDGEEVSQLGLRMSW